MAELVDALVSGTSIERCGGSSPLLGTNTLKPLIFNGFFVFIAVFDTVIQIGVTNAR